MEAVKGVLSTISGIFGKVGEIFGIVSDFLKPILDVIGGVLSVVGEILSRSSALVFLVGFYGLLLAFIWFLFCYLDKKRLTLPVVAFTFAFLVFISGNLMMISNEQKSAKEAKASTQVEETVLSQDSASSAESGDDNKV
ncbi:MAG: hypothetical protein J5449_01290 [Oscillospiraceae bacterium]|nr:hypothetical protein [Oscillospiraceae bacterium]